jgi:hypothetical protein
LKVIGRFGGTYLLHFQGWGMSQARNQNQAGSKLLVSCLTYSLTLKMDAACFSETPVDPMDCMALCSRRYNSS